MNCSRRALLWLCSGLPLSGAGFRTDKEFSTWSDEEIDALLTDSPWAKRISAKIQHTDSRRGGMELPGGIGIGMPGGRVGPGETEGRRPGLDRPTLLLRWCSALPIQLALVAKRYGADAPNHRPQSVPPTYTLELLGLPQRHAMRDDDLIREGLRATTALCRKGKYDLSAESVELVPVEGQLNLVFRFSKYDAIRREDKEVTFTTALGTLKISCRFKLKNMTYQGKLCL
jgi:hypothetical protein